MLAPFRVSMLACLASATGMAAVGFGLSRPEGIIERSFAQALEQLDETTAMRAGTGFDAAHVHLSRLPASQPGPAVTVGDRITLSQRDGGAAAYEVIDVRPLPGTTLGEAGASPSRLMMVTAVATVPRLGPGMGSSNLTIRFIVDAEPQIGAETTSKPRAL